MLSCKIFLVFSLVAAAFSLECVFEVKASPTSLDITGGVDKCESGDEFCAKIGFNEIAAKGCSKTTGKISGVGMLTIECKLVGCDPVTGVCCCKGNKCNEASGMSAVLPVLTVALVKMFI